METQPGFLCYRLEADSPLLQYTGSFGISTSHEPPFGLCFRQTNCYTRSGPAGLSDYSRLLVWTTGKYGRVPCRIRKPGRVDRSIYLMPPACTAGVSGVVLRKPNFQVVTSPRRGHW